MVGYVRKDTANNIADGNVVNASDLDNEFDGVVAAFNASTGHAHGGGTGEGSPILTMGPTQDVTVSATLLAPKTTNTVDIGSTALKFKDLYMAGNASIGGTLTVTGVATLGNGAVLGTPASVTLTNATGLPVGTGISGFGTGIATALAVNVGSAGAPVLFNGALGAPSSGTVTNLTGTASININGTVGATTANTGAFTTLNANAATTASANKGAINYGTLSFSDTGIVQSAQTSVNSYFQNVMQNTNAGASASAEFIAYNDQGTASTNYATVGINSSGYSGTGSINAAGYGYFLTASTDLVLGTIGANGIHFTTNSSASDALAISSTGAISIPSSGVANGVAYLNGSKVLTTGSALTFDGATLQNLRNTTDGTAAALMLWNQGTTSSYATLSQNAGTVGYQQFADAAGNAGVAGMTFRTTSNHPMAWGINNAEQMRLTSTGLGIGTSSPATGVHLQRSSGNTYYRAQNNLTNVDVGVDGGGTGILWNNGNYPLAFGTSNTERARIDSSGRLLVGGTTADNSAFMELFYNGLTYNGLVTKDSSSSGTTYSNVFVKNGSTVGSISQTTTGTLYNVTSDYRLKTVIGLVADSGSRIDALEPVEYEWKADGSRTRGFLAHKFQEVYAGSVTGTKDATDVNGKPIYQGLQAGTSEVIADLVAEIQSLRKRLAALEAK